MTLQYGSTTPHLLRHHTHTYTQTHSRCSQTPPAVSARLSVDRCVIWEVRRAERRFPVSSWHLPSKLSKHSLQLPCVCAHMCVCVCVCSHLYLNVCAVVCVHLCACVMFVHLYVCVSPKHVQVIFSCLQSIISSVNFMKFILIIIKDI